MSAVSSKPKKSTTIRNYAIVSGTIAAIALSLFAYLMWYVAPEEVMEPVKIITVGENGCVGETLDGYPVNIGQCDAQPGEVIFYPVDQKVKERQDLMNPTGQ